MEGNAAFVCVQHNTTQHKTPSLLHSDLPQSLENQQDWSDAKKMVSEGCFMYHLVTKQKLHRQTAFVLHRGHIQ
jgi:hypothetical protein